MHSLAASIVSAALCGVPAHAFAGAPPAHTDNPRDASVAGEPPRGYFMMGFIRNPGGFAEFFMFIDAAVDNATAIAVTPPSGVSYDLHHDIKNQNFSIELGAPTQGEVLVGTGTAGDSRWTIVVEHADTAVSTYEFDAFFEDHPPTLPGAVTITDPLEGAQLGASPTTMAWTEPALVPGIVEVSANIDQLDEIGGSIVAGKFACSLIEGCLTLDPGSPDETSDVPIHLEPGVYQARVEYISLPTIEPISQLITPLVHSVGPQIDWGLPDFVPPDIAEPGTPLVAYSGLRNNDFTIVGPCTAADLSEPFGDLDFSDVLAFLVAFGAMDPAADLSEPLGVLDFDDVLAFLIAFGAGCP